jgi:hypothetical protein
MTCRARMVTLASAKECYGTQDWHSKGRTNVIGALLNRCLLTLGLFDENVNADVFTTCVEQDLSPKLSKCPSRKSQICDENGGFPRTVAERTKRYLSNGSAGNRHLQSIDRNFMDGH